jgi:hypothetical protein
MNSDLADTRPDPPIVADDEATDLPALRTWPVVYAFVLGTFVVWIVLLTALSRAFS